MRLVLLCGSAALWLAGIAVGIRVVYGYESTPGEPALSPARWPGASAILPHANQSSLLMLVHPQCSCTSASLEELREIVGQTSGRASISILVVDPPGAAGKNQADQVSKTLKGIGGITIVHDRNGVEAARFGARTSGQVLLYAADGRLLFSGGITGSRGHVGNNIGRQDVIDLIRHPQQPPKTHAVFGCSLFGSRLAS